MIPEKAIGDEFSRVVHNYLLIEKTALTQADFGLVFGNRHIIELLADQAAELYHAGLFPLIVTSGGIRTSTRITEAEALRRELLKRGIPNKAIMTEKGSSHTGENVALSRALLQRKGLENSMSSVISIGHIKAARRFLMTLECRWPELHKMHVSVNPYQISPELWHQHDGFRQDVLREYQKIAPYLDRKQIREIDMDALNQRTIQMQQVQKSDPAAFTP